jgi:hypothetical protein
MAANALAPDGFRGGGFRAGGFRDRDFGRGFHHHRGRRFAFGVGLGYGLYGPYGYDDDYYGYPDYAYGDTYYGDSYYDDGGCYVVQRRVHTRYGWRLRPVQVCS